MGMNAVYNGAEDCPPVIAVFPLGLSLIHISEPTRQP